MKLASPRYAVVAMNERGTFEWVIGRNSERYRYGYRLSDDWSYSTTELTNPSHDGDRTGYEDLLSMVQHVKASERQVAFIASNHTSLSTLNQETVPSRMAGEVSRMISFYQPLLKKDGVSASLILRLIELRNSLEVVSRTMLPTDNLELEGYYKALGAGDATYPFTMYFRHPEFNAIPVVKTGTSTAGYAYRRLLTILNALSMCPLTSQLVSTATEDLMRSFATKVSGYSPLQVNHTYKAR